MKKARRFSRRDVLGSLLALAPLAAWKNSSPHQPVQPSPSGAAVTVQDVINLILKEIPGAPFNQTVDTLKSGRSDLRVTGIVTTMFATVPIIEETVKRGANFIIAHEPTYFNHTDDPRWAGENDIVKRKQALLDKHQVTVWRCHDYWHAIRPDGIFHGVVRKLGWQSFADVDKRLVTISPQRLDALARTVKSALGIGHMRYIGAPDQQVSRIALIPGAAGGQTHLRVVESLKPDLLIVGEVHEWETAEYIRDSMALGEKRSLMVLGHPVSEEPGMEWMAEWLKPKLPGLSIHHIATPDPFVWI